MASEERYPRVFVGWDNGAFVNSEAGVEFQALLGELVEQYGAPDTVEYREVYEG